MYLVRIGSMAYSDQLKNLECVAKLTNGPLVLQERAWYVRVTDTEAVTHDPDRRRLMDAHRTPASETSPPEPAVRRAPADPGSRGVHRHSVRAPERHSVEHVAQGDGLRLREHMLAAARALAAGRRLEAAPSGAADRTAPARPARCG